MTVRLHDSNILLLEGACPVEDAGILLEHICAIPDAIVDWRGCEWVHAAVLQVLLVTAVEVKGPPAGAFLRSWVDPMLMTRTG
ncbi:hypothetical protein V5F77_19350 [Xanthobacter sp. DSM 24535]|uniref:hypothetical protein n=1 Tax=Roseixanthobacter psychrophilus TaxID=3119917 RepID=UPI00372B0D6C